MTTQTAESCDFFLNDIRRSNVVPRDVFDEHCDAVVRDNPDMTPAKLADRLVREGVLTKFQAQRLLVSNTDLVMGSFILTDELGSGSLGAVYKGFTRGDDQPYAVQTLPRRNMLDVNRFKRLTKCFADLRHPNLAHMAEIGNQAAWHYLAWPLIENAVSLQDVVAKTGPLEPGLAAQYTLQTAEALDACHQVGLTHGLVKPANLMVNRQHQIKLLNLGIWQLLKETQVIHTGVAANLTADLDCASPEGVLDPTRESPASDRYSLGCTLYFLLTGKYPFGEGTTTEKIVGHQSRQPRPVQELQPDVPEAMAALIDTLMRKAPEERYTSTAEVVALLKPMASPVPSEPPALLAAEVRPEPEPEPEPVVETKPVHVEPAAPRPKPSLIRAEPQPNPPLYLIAATVVVAVGSAIALAYVFLVKP